MTGFRYKVKSKNAYGGFFAFAVGMLFAVSADAGDLHSDNLPCEPVVVEDFMISDDGDTRASSMAAFAGAILHKNEAVNMPYLFKAVAANPDSAVLIRYLTDRIRKSKQRKAYQAQLEKLAWRHPESLRLTLSVIIIMVAEKRKDKAIELAERSYKDTRETMLPAEQRPLFISLVRLLGAFRMDKKKFTEAVELYNQVLDNPEYANVPQLLEAGAVIYDRAAKKADNESFLWFDSDREELEGQRDDAIARLESLTLEKYDPVAFNALFAVFNSLKQPERAFEVILKRMIYEPDNKLLRKMLALSFFKQKDFQLSFYAWQSMAADRLLQTVDLLMYGESAWKSKQFGLARATLVQYMKKYPRNLQARLILSMALYDSGEDKKAWRLLKTMPNSTVVMHLKSMILMRGEKYAESLKVLQQIEKVYIARKAKPSVNLYLSMSFMAEKVGNVALFEKYTLTLYKLDPKRKAEWDNSLGYVWADNNLKLAEAEKLLRSAVAANKKPENLDSLAWVLFRQKKYAESKKYIAEAIAIQHDIPDAVIADHAGDIYLANGDRQAALKYWRLSLRIYGDGLDHRKIQAKIAALEKNKKI
jgi:hypothetical protein